MIMQKSVRVAKLMFARKRSSSPV